MNVAAKHYQTGAENIATAHAIRQRLMGRPEREKPVATNVEPEQPKPRPRPPLWQKWPMSFDAHVHEWRERMLSPCKAHIRQRCDELGVSYDEIIGTSTNRTLSLTRHLLIWEVKTKFDLSFPAIGRFFGGRDHTSIIFAYRKIERLKAEGEIAE